MPPSASGMGGGSARPATPVPVSASLDVPIGADGDAMRHGSAAIDRVHMDGTLPTVVVTREPLVDMDADYRTAPPRIAVGEQASQPEFSFIHEVGHLLDHQGLGTPGDWASARSPDLKPWRDAVAASRSFRRLQLLRRLARTMGGPVVADLDYLMQPFELWARSYTQYVAVRSGDQALIANLATRRTLPGGESSPHYWDDGDFAAIGAAIDDLFRAKGWIP